MTETPRPRPRAAGSEAGTDADPAMGRDAGAAAGSDAELAEALARAFRQQRGRAGAIDAPPFAEIVERAETRIRARASRRVAASLAAAAIVLVGGAVAWNALDPVGDSDSVLVTGDAAPRSAPGKDETAPADDSASQPGQAEAAGAGAGVPEGSDQAAADESAGAFPVTPEQLSTGPVLQWSEISVPFEDAIRLESDGDGRVVALSRDGERGRVFVTTDGVNWAEVPLPEGIHLHHIDISGSRWLATGTGIADAGDGSDSTGFGWPGSLSEGPTRVFYSDDQGTAWTELALEIGSEPASPYVVAQPWVTQALTFGENMVLVGLSIETLDVEALLADRGLVPEGQRVIGWGTHTDYQAGTLSGTLEFTLGDRDGYSGQGSWGVSVGSSGTDSSPPTPETPESAGSSGPEAGYVESFRAGDPASARVSFDDLGLTADQRAILIGEDFDAEARIYWSDGGPFELAAARDYWVHEGIATEDGFLLLGSVDGATSTSRRALLSPDGRTWSEQTLEGSGYPVGGQAAVGADGRTIWSLYAGIAGPAGLQRFRYGEDPVTVFTFDERLSLAAAAGGPAGLALTAHVWTGDDDMYDGDLAMPTGRLAKDGYELRYGEPEGGITLWDLSEDAAVYVFGPESVASGATPEGVREIDEDGEFAVVFENPETGADLVTFTMEDLSEVFATAYGPTDDQFLDYPESWVGWSADGSAWGWQKVAEAFGVDSDDVWAQLAVGGDFVLARVESIEAVVSATSTGQDGDQSSGEMLARRTQLPRWFISKLT